jgi:uncharacterized protein YjiS (DUF1127 family)
MSKNRADFGLATERFFARSNAPDRAAPSAKGPAKFGKRGAVMMECLYGEIGVLPLRRHHDRRKAAVGLSETVWLSSVSLVDLPAHHASSPGSPLNPALDRPAPPRGETSDFTPLTAIRRIFAALRRWGGRFRPQQPLRELSDHLLKDIGLSRVVLAYDAQSRSGAGLSRPSTTAHCANR